MLCKGKPAICIQCCRYDCFSTLGGASLRNMDCLSTTVGKISDDEEHDGDETEWDETDMKTRSPILFSAMDRRVVWYAYFANCAAQRE